MSGVTGAIGSLIAYRIGRIESTINAFDEELAHWFNLNYREKQSIEEAIDITRRNKFDLEKEVGSLTRLSLNHSPHFVTGIVDRLKVRYDMAKRGIVQTHINNDDWTIEGWEKYHLNINKISGAAKKAGKVGLYLAGGVDGINIVASYLAHGWSNRLGEDFSKNIGDFTGIWYGGKTGEQVAKYALKRGLGRTVINFGVDTLQGVEGVGAAEAVAEAATAVLLSPELAIVGGGALIVGVGYLGAKYGADLFSTFTTAAYHKTHNLINFLEKRYCIWM